MKQPLVPIEHSRVLSIVERDGMSITLRDGFGISETPDHILKLDILGLAGRCAMNFVDAGVLVLDEASAQRFAVRDDMLTNGWGKIRLPGLARVNLAVTSRIPELVTDQDLPLHHRRYPLFSQLEGFAEGFPMDTSGTLALWHMLTGTAWYGTPASAGSDMLEECLREIDLGKYRINLKPKDAGPETDARESDYLVKHWSRPAAPGPLVGYDANRMYLAAAAVVGLAPWALRKTGPIAFDRKLAGWWLIDVPPWNDPRLPDPAGYASTAPGPSGLVRRWVTTPTAELLTQLAEQGRSAGFEVLDSWTCTAKRLLNGWSGKLEYAYQSTEAPLTQLDDESDRQRVRVAVKAAYRSAIGMLATNARTYSTYRPDWQASIIAMARCNLWRKIAKAADTGRYPVRIATDEVVYELTSETPPAGITVTDRLGGFKIKHTEQM